jgi:hypothetical protein
MRCLIASISSSDIVSRSHRFIAPAMEQRKKSILIGLQLLQWLALDAGYNTGNQPARQAQLDYGNQRRIHVRAIRDRLKVMRLALLSHEGAPSELHPRPWM